MADADSSSSSDDIWVEPEELTISTRDILNVQSNQTQKQTQPQEPSHYTTQNEHKTEAINDDEHDIKPNDTPNHTISEKQAPMQPIKEQEIETIETTESIETSELTEPDITSQKFSNNDGCTKWQEKNTSFPPALKAAYQAMAVNKNTKNDDDDNNDNNNNNNNNNENEMDRKHLRVIDKDKGLGYDIDNLPIDITETPMLSLKKLQHSASHKKQTTNNQNDHNTKKDSKGKYSKFFVKNFFLKKHDEHKEQKNNPNGNDNDDNDEQKHNLNLNRIKIRGNTKEKELNDLRLTQKISNAHKGAIYCMEFSKKGDYLATGGQDSVLRIWTVCGSRADLKRWENNDNNNKDKEDTKTKTKTGDTDTINIEHEEEEEEEEGTITTEQDNDDNNDEYEHEYNFEDIISIVAYREFTGHRADIIDISWSNGEFILSASIDQTVMLWHTSRSRCLCLFQHSDIVTSVQFHPNEDYLFLSGSFDSRLRLWNILEHRVVDWVQVPTLVTCTTFSINGKFAIAGLYDGQCFFYSTAGHRLKYVTAIECRNSSGKYRKGRKVTGLQYLPPPSNGGDTISSSSISAMNGGGGGIHNNHKNGMQHKHQEHGSPQLLISTNDSRLRLYNLSNFDMKCKYKGHENTQSQIHARFSPDGKLIICGSEDNNIYIWRVEKSIMDESNSIFQSKKNKNRQEYYEYFKSNSKLPQVALFAPHRTIHYIQKFKTVINKNAKEMYKNNYGDKIKHIILTADTEGHINIYTNHSNQKNYKYPYNHHHHHHHHHHRSNNYHYHRNNKKPKKKYK